MFVEKIPSWGRRRTTRRGSPPCQSHICPIASLTGKPFFPLPQLVHLNKTTRSVVCTEVQLPRTPYFLLRTESSHSHPILDRLSEGKRHHTTEIMPAVNLTDLGPVDWCSCAPSIPTFTLQPPTYRPGRSTPFGQSAASEIAFHAGLFPCSFLSSPPLDLLLLD